MGKLIIGVNDLATVNPELVKEWDFEKNGDLKPINVTAGSNKKVWWKCFVCNNEWQASINKRSRGRGCPQCGIEKRKKTRQNHISIENSFGTKFPHIAKEWDYEKNENLKPTDVTAGSGQKVWWKCQKGHSWQAYVYSRSGAGSGCPYCANQKVWQGFNDLATINPKLAEEWDYKKNGNLKPTDVVVGSKKKVWWLCKNGHSYNATITNRLHNNNCPYCSGRKVLKGFNDLAIINPILAKEWDYNKNNDLKPTDVTNSGSQKVWWLCEKGHSWKTTVNNRTKEKGGTGCPICNKESQTSFSEQAVFYFVKQYFPNAINGYKFAGKKELDIFIPSNNFAIEYDGKQWHKNTKKDIAKNKECKDQQIKLIRIREIINDEEANRDTYKNFDCVLFFHHTGNYSELSEVIEKILVIYLGVIPKTKIDVDACKKEIYDQYINSGKENSLAVKFPEITKEWNYEKNGNLKPEYVSYSSNKKVWWKCENGHSWEAVIGSRSKGSGCPYCSGRNAIIGETDLVTTNSTLAEEWDYEKNGDLKPTDVTAGSHKKIWWLCKKGHSYSSFIIDRTKGNGCPICSGKKVLSGDNDLATTNPALAEEWDYKKNGNLKPTDVTAHSNKKVWWLCNQGHSWDAKISGRSKGNGCPICSGKKVLSGDNDLATTNPALAEEWNYKKNGNLKPTDVTAHSNKKVWWLCKKGHSWEAKISGRSKGSGCPYCSGRNAIIGETDLVTTNSTLAEEWDYEKNGDLKPTDVTAGSGKKVWWLCKKGHSWEAPISSRSKGSGCPYCSGRNAIIGETDLVTTNPTLVEEWDYEKNGNLKPTDVTAGSGKKVWWLCKKGHSWQATIANRSHNGNGCPCCAGRKAILGENDLVTTNPTLAEEWDYEKNGNLKPTDVTAGSNKKVWWKCKKGHSWDARIADRTKGQGCPECGKEKQLKAVICIETNEKFESLKQAAEVYGIFYTGISACCTGKRKTAGGYHWKYAVDIDIAE